MNYNLKNKHMTSFNKVILAGNLTRDPEPRTTPNGNTIVNLGLASNRKYKTKDGEQKEETLFVDIDAFGRTGEVIAQYATKGSQLLVEGRLKLDQWEDQQSGQKRSKIKIILENFQFIGGKSDSESGSTEQPKQSYRETSDRGSVGSEDPGDNVPF